jgi:hypothetical protein
MEEVRYSYRALVGKAEWKIPRGTFKSSFDDKIVEWIMGK